MSIYAPTPRVSLEDWCAWTGRSWEKVRNVVGRSFRIPAPHENVYTMAANAVLRLILQYDVNVSRVGFLGLGTESSTDNAAGAVIVRGMVDRALLDMNRQPLRRSLEVPEFKHACLGGIYALKSALRYVSCDGDGELAIVVSADIAEYERGSSGEQTQGAGAVAMLIERHPRMLAIDLKHGGSASAYRGPDFRKPFARHFEEEFTPNKRRRSDIPVFSGRYSTYAYLDETVVAVEEMLHKIGVSADDYYQNVEALFFHRPYHHMPISAFSFLYVRSLAQSKTLQSQFLELCTIANVSPDTVRTETRLRPDLYSRVLDGRAEEDPAPATNRAASVLRQQPGFQALLRDKMSLGGELVKELGNLYSAALPAWLAAGLEQAYKSAIDLTNIPMLMVGYGSGDAAEALPMKAVPGWREPASRIAFHDSLSRNLTLSKEQYEALHDGTPLTDCEISPVNEFAILRVGSTYDATFQDLGVEYYGYAGAGIPRLHQHPD